LSEEKMAFNRQQLMIKSLKTPLCLYRELKLLLITVVTFSESFVTFGGFLALKKNGLNTNLFRLFKQPIMQYVSFRSFAG